MFLQLMQNGIIHSFTAMFSYLRISSNYCEKIFNLLRICKVKRPTTFTQLYLINFHAREYFITFNLTSSGNFIIIKLSKYGTKSERKLTHTFNFVTYDGSSLYLYMYVYKNVLNPFKCYTYKWKMIVYIWKRGVMNHHHPHIYHNNKPLTALNNILPGRNVYRLNYKLFLVIHIWTNGGAHKYTCRNPFRGN